MGDAPTKVFFRAPRNKDQDYIAAIRNEGVVVTDEEQVKQVFVKALSNVVGSRFELVDNEEDRVAQFLASMERSVGEEVSLLLGRSFTVQKLE